MSDINLPVPWARLSSAGRKFNAQASPDFPKFHNKASDLQKALQLYIIRASDPHPFHDRLACSFSRATAFSF